MENSTKDPLPTHDELWPKLLNEGDNRFYSKLLQGPEAVKAVDAHRAWLGYSEVLDELKERTRADAFRYNDADKAQLEIFRTRYEALQARFAEQQASEVIASNTHLAQQQAKYALIVTWVVGVQALVAALALAVAYFQWLHPH
ncbi:MAG: hypothetical protein ABI548_18780 [Polyangiaceae bacterium]